MTPERIAQHRISSAAGLHPIFPWRNDTEGLRFIDDWAANLDRGQALEDAYQNAIVSMILHRHAPAVGMTTRTPVGD